MIKQKPLPLMFLHPRPDDKRVVVDALENFHGFQVGASTPTSMVSFVRDVGKPYFVDPMAYMFALPPEAVKDRKTGEIRRSLSMLAKRYGNLLDQTLGKRVLSAADLLDQVDVLDEITRNALEYQRSKMAVGDMNLFNPYFAKYAQIAAAGEDVPHSSTATSPWVLIPPFFQFENVEDPWYTATLRCAKLAAKHRQPGEKIYPTLFVTPQLLDRPKQIGDILSDIDEQDFDGIFIWVNGMEEETSVLPRLQTLASFIAKTAEMKPVFKLYGGYFSALLHSKGLSGFSCSLNHKTARNVGNYKWIAPPVPKPKFYIPRLHRAYKLEEAAQVLKMFPFLRCDCALCKQSYGENLDIFTQRMTTPGYTDRHFLNARKRELLQIQNNPQDALEELDDTIGHISKNGLHGIRHLAKWRALFQDQRPLSAKGLYAVRAAVSQLVGA